MDVRTAATLAARSGFSAVVQKAAWWDWHWAVQKAYETASESAVCLAAKKVAWKAELTASFAESRWVETAVGGSVACWVAIVAVEKAAALAAKMAVKMDCRLVEKMVDGTVARMVAMLETESAAATAAYWDGQRAVSRASEKGNQPAAWLVFGKVVDSVAEWVDLSGACTVPTSDVQQAACLVATSVASLVYSLDAALVAMSVGYLVEKVE